MALQVNPRHEAVAKDAMSGNDGSAKALGTQQETVRVNVQYRTKAISLRNDYFETSRPPDQRPTLVASRV